MDNLTIQEMDREEVVDTTRSLVEDYIKYVAGETNSSYNEPSKTLIRLCDDLTDKHIDMIHMIMSNLMLSPDNVHDTIYRVAEEIIKTGINWGRIALIVWFGGLIVKYKSYSRNFVSEIITSLLVDKTLERIIINGGWDAFIEKFKKLETSVYMKAVLYALDISSQIMELYLIYNFIYD